MTSFLSGLFTQASFIPHGVCLAWDPAVMLLFVLSDSAIAIAYYTIPFALIYFIYRRRDLAFRGIFALTGVFIVACGATHIMDVVTFWYPAYWTDVAIKFFTAVISIFTAAAMWWVMPAGASEHGAARGCEPSSAARNQGTAARRGSAAEPERGTRTARCGPHRRARNRNRAAASHRRHPTRQRVTLAQHVRILRRWHCLDRSKSALRCGKRDLSEDDRLHGGGAVQARPGADHP